MVSSMNDRTEIELGMSNFDGSIDEGFADALKAGHVFGRHAAWNFNASVWWNGDKFESEVWIYGSPVCRFQADTLEDLMRMANDEYGAA